MDVSRLLSAARQCAALTLVCVMTLPGWAQETPAPAAPSAATPPPASSQQFQLIDYSKPRSHFPNLIRPYLSREIPPANLSNTPRIETLLKEGKLYLSIDDAVALALENNLDIAIARYNLNIADTDILRAKAGATILGVNSGIVQNTPGGGTGGLSGTVGSGTGGTSVGAGGVGTGAGGLVFSTLGSGPNITTFDPVFTGTVQFDRNNLLSTSSFAIPVTTQNSTVADFSYLQGFMTGTALQVGFNNTRATTDSPFQALSPTLNSNFQARITQHLLQGLGFAPNNRFIRIAKNNREISDIAFRLQVTTTVDQIENIYCDMAYAYEYVRVQQENLAFAQKTLSDTKKQVEIGTLAPIEIVRAQSTVASDLQTLTVAQTNLELQQLLMKNALSKTLEDPRLVDAEVVPTSALVVPPQEPVTITQDMITEALTHRPELAQARINLTNNEISNKAVRNALLPSVDVFAYYGGSGLGGAQNTTNLCINNDNSFGCSKSPVAPVSYATTLNQLVDSTASDKGVGFQLNIPLRNRVAQSIQVRADLEYRQAQVRLQQLENQVRIEVRNAQFSVQQNRASVDAARAAVELAVQSLDAEQKKLALGASTTTLVLQNRTALTQAQSTLVSAMSAYAKARIEQDRATGSLLDHANILVSDAERGQVTKMPNVPNVGPRPNTNPYGTPQPQLPEQPQPPPQPQQ